MLSQNNGILEFPSQLLSHPTHPNHSYQHQHTSLSPPSLPSPTRYSTPQSHSLSYKREPSDAETEYSEDCSTECSDFTLGYCRRGEDCDQVHGKMEKQKQKVKKKWGWMQVWENYPQVLILSGLRVKSFLE